MSEMELMQLFEGSITDVHGIKVGHAQNRAARTGVTVVLCGHDGAVGGVDVRGAAPGTRETDLLRPGNLVERAHAVVLSGGSAFGLDSAGGVMRYLERKDIGIDMGVCRVPIVPAAVIYDLAVGDPKVRPDAAMGFSACEHAAKETPQGQVGAGMGATVGKLVPGGIPQNGGVGSASITLPCGVTVGAIAVVNAAGDIYHPHTGRLVACAMMEDGTRVPAESLLYGHVPAVKQKRIQEPTPGQNTTIAVIATDAVLSKEQANRLATVAHDGLARTIRPVHTQMDGDTVFALATGRVDADVNFIQLCALASEVMARAILNGVLAGNTQ